jgi:hypothetical protein
MPVIERIYKQDGLIHVSLEGLAGDRRVRKIFTLPLNLEHWAQYLLDWMFRESLYGGLNKVINATSQFVERTLEKGSGGKVRLEIISSGMASIWLSRWGKMKWKANWLAYKIKTALKENKLVRYSKDW